MSEDMLTTRSGSDGLVERAKAILMTPKQEWPKVAAETTSPTQVLLSYALPLIAIGPIANLIGQQLFGINVFFATIRPSLGFSLSTAITALVMSVVSLFVLSFIANFLSPKFGGKDDFPAAFRLVAYSMTAAWLVGILGLLAGLMPALGLLGLLLGLYSIYLLYLGSTPVMSVPQDKATGYTAVTFVAAIVLYLVAAALVASMTGAFGLAAGAGMAASSEQATIDLGELGSVTVDGENSTVDLGELGRVEVDGDTATLTVDGEEVEMDVEALKAQAAALEAQAEAARAAAE